MQEGDQACRCRQALSGSEGHGRAARSRRPAEPGRGQGHMEKGLGSDPLLCGQVTGETVQVSAQGTVPSGLPCLRLGSAAGSSWEATWAERACGQEGWGRGRCLATVPLSHCPERRWLKRVLTSGRPGSKHRGVSMETTTQDQWGPGMGGVASARCGQG